MYPSLKKQANVKVCVDYIIESWKLLLFVRYICKIICRLAASHKRNPWLNILSSPLLAHLIFFCFLMVNKKMVQLDENLQILYPDLNCMQTCQPQFCFVSTLHFYFLDASQPQVAKYCRLFESYTFYANLKFKKTR